MDKEKLDRILATLTRMEKAGTLSKMFRLAPEVPKEDLWKSSGLPFISADKGFKDIREACLIRASIALEEMEKEMSWASYYFDYTKNLYESYKPREKDIKQPDILKFIKDYEDFYKGD